MRRIFFPWRVNIAVVRWGFCADYVVKFASPSCVRLISFDFLLATACVWVWMVCSLHSVTTDSRDRAYVPLIIIIIIQNIVQQLSESVVVLNEVFKEKSERT